MGCSNLWPRCRESRNLCRHSPTSRKSAPNFKPRAYPPQAEIAYGDPANEIIKWVEQKGCDLVAMSTHGHRFLADIFLGTTANRVQHRICVPVLLLRAR